MQILGLSDSTPKTEGRLKALFWPTIRNDGDVDYISQQGFWVCFALASFTLIIGVIGSQNLFILFDVLYMFLAGVGVRQLSRFAAAVVFANYLAGSLLTGIGVVSVIFLGLLLANVRSTWLSARWQSSGDSTPVRLHETLGDKICDQIPARIWPAARWLFYPMAVIESAMMVWLWALRTGIIRLPVAH